jgi:hypothetical protein
VRNIRSLPDSIRLIKDGDIVSVACSIRGGLKKGLELQWAT